MEPFISYLQIRCATCQEPLIRISQSESADNVVCPICYAIGPYNDVIEEGAFLTRQPLLSQDSKDFIDQLRRRRSLRALIQPTQNIRKAAL